MANKITTKYLLDLVSRSFALAIPLLDKNKKIKVEVQYLLARIIDTIEDLNSLFALSIILFKTSSDLSI